MFLRNLTFLKAVGLGLLSGAEAATLGDCKAALGAAGLALQSGMGYESEALSTTASDHATKMKMHLAHRNMDQDDKSFGAMLETWHTPAASVMVKDDGSGGCVLESAPTGVTMEYDAMKCSTKAAARRRMSTKQEGEL